MFFFGKEITQNRIGNVIFMIIAYLALFLYTFVFTFRITHFSSEMLFKLIAIILTMIIHIYLITLACDSGHKATWALFFSSLAVIPVIMKNPDIVKYMKGFIDFVHVLDIFDFLI